MLGILLIPAALCYTFGRMVGNTRQGWAILAAMTVLFVVLLGLGVWAEQRGNPRIAALGVDTAAGTGQPGGNMEGKEVRFGIANSALWAAATTAASNGSVNSMHDSYTPLGGLVPMFLIQLGEVVFGGVGSGLYGMLIFAIIAVFVAGLMVGRTPEYLGKKIEAHEIKMASLVILIPPLLVLGCTAVASIIEAGLASRLNGGPHGFNEILYAFSSMGNNNGSASAGLNANVPFYNLLGGVAMLIARYWLAIPVLAIAGSLAVKKNRAFRPGSVADGHAAVRGSARGCRADRRRFDVPARPGAGSDRRASDDGERVRSDANSRQEPSSIRPSHCPHRDHRGDTQARSAPSSAQPGDVRGRGRLGKICSSASTW
jgi:K+-transporting ATPase ATPase A chain